MKFALIGTGFIMPRHAEAIYAVGGKIVDVANTAHGEDAWRKMVRETAADCVVILAPNNLHFPMAMAALDAEKIVLCEKPLSFRVEELRTLAARPNIFTVLQLKYHPLVAKLAGEISRGGEHRIEMDISVYRDKKYYESWKGKKELSGGILFNLGIHYFDLLIHLFGEPTTAGPVSYDPKTASGSFEGNNYSCAWRLSTDELQDSQRRVFRVNGADYNFSSKDNLSYENLHREVYRDLLRGKGVTPAEAIPATALINDMYKSAGIEFDSII